MKKIILLISFLFVILIVSATEFVGPNNPSAANDDSSIGTITWANPTNVYSSNDARASATGTESSTLTHNLNVTGFGFNLPSDATAVGIVVEIEGYVNYDQDQLCSFCITGGAGTGIVQLETAGALKGNNGCTPDVSYPHPTEAYVTFGGSTDLWGTTWTPAQINAKDFGVVIRSEIGGV